MPATIEIRFYCDRCRSPFATSGEDGSMPPRDQVMLIMSSVEAYGTAGWNAHSPDALSLSHGRTKGDVVIGSGQNAYDLPTHYEQVCPRCFTEFRAAQERIQQWWTSGAKMLATSEVQLLASRPPSGRIAAASAVTKRARRGGS